MISTAYGICRKAEKNENNVIAKYYISLILCGSEKQKSFEEHFSTMSYSTKNSVILRAAKQRAWHVRHFDFEDGFVRPEKKDNCL